MCVLLGDGSEECAVAGWFAYCALSVVLQYNQLCPGMGTVESLPVSVNVIDAPPRVNHTGCM